MRVKYHLPHPFTYILCHNSMFHCMRLVYQGNVEILLE